MADIECCYTHPPTRFQHLIYAFYVFLAYLAFTTPVMMKMFISFFFCSPDFHIFATEFAFEAIYYWTPIENFFFCFFIIAQQPAASFSFAMLQMWRDKSSVKFRLMVSLSFPLEPLG